MGLKIRMSRAGTTNRAFYRIVVADSRSPRDGRYLERLGTYNPLLPRDHKDRVVLKLERIKHWMGVGALPSDRVHRFLAKVGVMEAPKIRPQTKKDKPKTKAQERLKAAEEAAAKAAEAPETPAAG
ncbi:MAG: 30S ribosomal protein S16 [Alphaproteobacteria bacterium]|jgi:small subunit ribosomal protein S16|nr:30S ribosomal protein S16 [Alphaproteobacteria bacterium]PHY00943.1 MAG: 30S ribosomal protein S16 [Rhodospirillaceae bacterium]